MKMRKRKFSIYIIPIFSNPYFPEKLREDPVISRSHLKIKILVQDPPLKPSGIKTRSRVLPAGILKYVEDLKRGSNTEVGPKDYFESLEAIKRFIPCFAQQRKLPPTVITNQ